MMDGVAGSAQADRVDVGDPVVTVGALELGSLRLLPDSWLGLLHPRILSTAATRS